MAVTFTSVNRYSFKYGVQPQKAPTTGDTNNNPIYRGFPVQVVADVSSNVGIDEVRLWYKGALEGSYTNSILMTKSNTSPYNVNWNNNHYNAIIPGAGIPTDELNYYVEVTETNEAKGQSSVYATLTEDAPANARSALWISNLVWAQRNMAIDETSGSLMIDGGSGGVPMRSSDLRDWIPSGPLVGGGDGRGTFSFSPIITLQGPRWFFWWTYKEYTGIKADEEQRAFYFIHDAPHHPIVPPRDQPGGEKWRPLQNTYNYYEPGTPPGDCYFHGVFSVGRPVVRDGYFYLANWVNFDKAGRVGAGVSPYEDYGVVSAIRIIRISIDDLLQGKLFDTFHQFEMGYFFGDDALTESYLINNPIENKLYLLVRSDGTKHTYITTMDWDTFEWSPPYDLGEGIPAKGFCNDYGTVFVSMSQRNYSAQIPEGENSNETFLYHHLAHKPYNEWEPREYIGDCYAKPLGLSWTLGYADVKQFRGRVIYNWDGGFYKLLPHHDTPEIAKVDAAVVDNNIVAHGHIYGINEGDTIICQYKDANGDTWHTFTQAPVQNGDMFTATEPQTINMPHYLVVRFGVLRSDTWYYGQTSDVVERVISMQRPMLTRQQNNLLATSQITGLLEGETPAFFYRDAYDTSGIMPHEDTNNSVWKPINDSLEGG